MERDDAPPRNDGARRTARCAVGHEWAKENDVRKITTDDIRSWYIVLDEAKDAEAAVARIESEAARAFARR